MCSMQAPETHVWEYSDGKESSFAFAGVFWASSTSATTCGAWFCFQMDAKSMPRRSSSACVLTYTTAICKPALLETFGRRTGDVKR